MYHYVKDKFEKGEKRSPSFDDNNERGRRGTQPISRKVPSLDGIAAHRLKFAVFVAALVIKS
jgi:hypothetical protein